MTISVVANAFANAFGLLSTVIACTSRLPTNAMLRGSCSERKILDLQAIPRNFTGRCGRNEGHRERRASFFGMLPDDNVIESHFTNAAQRVADRADVSANRVCLLLQRTWTGANPVVQKLRISKQASCRAKGLPPSSNEGRQAELRH